MATEHIVIDLRTIKYQIDTSGLHESELTERCPRCGDTISQLNDECPGCKTPVVWFYSPTWKRRFGNPDEVLRQHLDLTPETRLEREIVNLFGLKGLFTSKTQRDQVRGIIRAQGEPWIWKSLDFKHQIPGLPFRSWLTHARNNKPASFGRRGHEEDEHETVEHEEELPW